MTNAKKKGSSKIIIVLAIMIAAVFIFSIINAYTHYNGTCHRFSLWAGSWQEPCTFINYWLLSNILPIFLILYAIVLVFLYFITEYWTFFSAAATLGIILLIIIYYRNLKNNKKIS